MIKEKFLEVAINKFGEGGILNRKQIKEVASIIGQKDADKLVFEHPSSIIKGEDLYF